MTISHLLERFDETPKGADGLLSLTEVGLEEIRLSSFEDGYKAGWDDATRSQVDETSHISQELAQNLRDMSFTYHEAHAGIMKSLKSVFQQIVDVLVPEIARSSLGPQLLEEIENLIFSPDQNDVEIVVNPANIPKLTSILEDRNISTVKLSSEETLGDGQAYVRSNRAEKQIDLDAATKEICDAIRGHYQQLEQDIIRDNANVG